MTTAEKLRAARALIDTPEKWSKGGKKAHPGCLCLVDALAEATRKDGDWLDLKPYVNHALGRHADDILFVWNDRPSTTHADVLDALDRAIEAAA